jgi:hypothetical protein
MFFVTPPPALWLMPTVPNNWWKILEVSTVQEEATDCIRRLLSKWQTSFRFCHIRLPKFAKCTLSDPYCRTIYFSMECHISHFGKEPWRFMLPSAPHLVIQAIWKWATVVLKTRKEGGGGGADAWTWCDANLTAGEWFIFSWHYRWGMYQNKIIHHTPRWLEY